MKNFKLQKRAIEKNKFHESLIIILFSLVTVFLVYALSFSFIEKNHDALSFLTTSLGILPYLQIFLIFFTYEICQKLHGYYEAVSVSKKGVFDMFKTHLSVICFYVLMLTAEVTVLNLIETFLTPQFCGALFFNVISALFFCFFLGCLAAVFIGFMFSFIKHRVIFYFFVILIALSQIDYIKDVVSNIYQATGFNIIKLVELFNISSVPIDRAPNYHTGIVINNATVELILFWIVFSVFIFLVKQKSTAVRYKTVKSAVCLVLSAALMVGYLMPFAMIDMGNGPSGLFANYEYYERNEGWQKEEAADFKVTKYKLDLSAYRYLKARADIYVDKNNLEDYKFTLYHGFKVTKVTDQNGEKLNFSQETDYLTVLNSGNNDIEYIFVEYYGDGNKFYSNHSGMLLTGNFNYYPIPGRKVLFDMEHSTDGMVNCSLGYKTEFDVRVNNRSSVFCNLDETEKNHFTGVSDSATVLSGYFKSLELDGAEIFYPYLNPVYNEQFFKDEFTSFISKNPDVKKIFVIPKCNFSEKEGTALFDDYLVTDRDYDIEGFVLKSQSSKDKTDLAGFMSVHGTEDEEEYWQFVEETATFMQEEDKLKLMEVLEEVLSKGDEAVVEQINDYLVDDSDTRDSIEFLESLR